jgi:hypothetical protein
MTNQLPQSVLRLLVLGGQACAELIPQSLLLGLVRLVLQPLEDLIVGQSDAAKSSMLGILTSSSCGAAIEAVVVVGLEAWH